MRSGISITRNDSWCGAILQRLNGAYQNSCLPLNLGISFVLVNIAAGLWGYFCPYPYGLCVTVLICLPWLSIAAKRFIGSNEQALALSFLFPATALACRAINDIDCLTLGRFVLLGCGLSVLFVAGLLVSDRGAWRRYGVLLALTFVYGFGAVVETNMLLDSTVKRFSAPIISRDYYVGRHSRFQVVLGPWSDQPKPRKHFMSWNTYVALRGKRTACINQGAGAFGVPWDRILACPTKN
jgi:hypothetical protein